MEVVVSHTPPHSVHSLNRTQHFCAQSAAHHHSASCTWDNAYAGQPVDGAAVLGAAVTVADEISGGMSSILPSICAPAPPGLDYLKVRLQHPTLGHASYDDYLAQQGAQDVLLDGRRRVVFS